MTRLLLGVLLLATTTIARADGTAPPDNGATPPAPPAAVTPRARNVTPAQLDAAKLSGAAPHLSDATKARYRKAGGVQAMYKMCVTPAGDVASVAPLTPTPGVDEDALAILRTWKFKPQPTSLCAIQRFVWTIGP